MSGDQTYKNAWQKRKRAEFRDSHGYSQTAYYDNEGLRDAVLSRDGNQCVTCGMTAAEHLERWGRPITVDHVDRHHDHNEMANMQTLCLVCHGRKDILPDLVIPRVLVKREEILECRSRGESYQSIADRVGFSIAAVWKWVRRWEKEASGD